LSEVPFPVNGYEKKVEIDEPKAEFVIEKPEIIGEPQNTATTPPITNYQQPITNKPPVINQAFFDSIPVRMPEISAEDLEHFEDKKLDEAYEERLLREGDDLKVIKNASQILATILTAPVVTPIPSTNGTAAAPAKAKPKIDFKIPDFSTEPETTEIIELSDNPTEEEMRRYAENHPAVKRALRIFRGKIISVTKTNR